MKLFKVTWHEDGNTVKAPGVSETTIREVTAWYAAESIDEVWDVTAWIRNDPERTAYGIGEALESVTVVESSVTKPSRTGGAS